VRRLVVIGVALVATVGVAAPLSTAAGSRRQVAAQTASLTMLEFKFVSKQLVSAQFGKESILKPGPTAITFTNKGKFGHDFTIVKTSKGATKFRSGVIKPGASKTMMVNLKAGAYLAACLEFNGAHYAEGMVKVFTVGHINAKTGNWLP
jgi:plastocyanin